MLILSRKLDELIAVGSIVTLECGISGGRPCTSLSMRSSCGNMLTSIGGIGLIEAARPFCTLTRNYALLVSISPNTGSN